jgi:type III pantothenate kinase
MVLTIDIGNTTISLAAVKKNRIVKTWIAPTDSSNKQLLVMLAKVTADLKRSGLQCKVALICSVVPRSTTIVEQFVLKYLKIGVEVVGRDVSVPIKNGYRDPAQVGQDRLVGAFAAVQLYGKPLIVVDLGTAITFDAVSAKGEYLGGVIVPGLRLSAESLFLKTALLPQIDIKAPKTIIGRTTQESILSGLFYGYGSLCQGMITLISRHLKAKPTVVMTGGHTALMKKFIPSKIRIVDEHLVHKGLAMLKNP